MTEIKKIFNRFKDKIYKDTMLSVKLKLSEYIWCWNNLHNSTQIKLYSTTPLDIIKVGKNTYGTLHVHYFGNKNERLTIGSYCSIASGVHFILGGIHHPEYLMNYPLKRHLSLDIHGVDNKTKGPIIIGNDVWICTNVLILSGVKIGDGAIVAAGSVVSRDIPPYSIQIGNELLRYRFDEAIITDLVKIDWNNVNDEKLEKIVDEMYLLTNEIDLKKIVRILNE